jgi:hypothetical protein
MFVAYRTCHAPVGPSASTFWCGDSDAMLLIVQDASLPNGSKTLSCRHDRVARPDWNVSSTISVSRLAAGLEQASPNV